MTHEATPHNHGDSFPQPPVNPDLNFALMLADRADAITLANYLSASLTVETKPDRTPVTEGDRAVEQALRAMIAEQRGDDAVLGEEYGATGGLTGRSWVIDPIDGTANYLRGVPIWASLIGLLVDGEPQVGVVSAPALGRRWWAAPGICATRDVSGHVRDLHVSGVRGIADASVSFSDRVGWNDGALDRLLAGVWRSRAFGDFLSHMLVAEGAVDIAAEPELAPWDVAALMPIVTGAGGQVSSTAGGAVLQPGTDSWEVPAGMVSTNGLLHSAAIHRIGGG
jgi:histidinol-phosphatase